MEVVMNRFVKSLLAAVCVVPLCVQAQDTPKTMVKLDEMQEYVTQHGGTEVPFHNAYWNNHAEGIYVDIISGRPLFSSTDKFDSGTGWPSFSKPIDENFVKQKTDSS